MTMRRPFGRPPSGLGARASGFAQRAQRLAQRAAGGEHGRWLVAAVGHAVVAALVSTAPVLVPVGLVDELAIGLDVAVAHQIAGALPAEQRVAGDRPGRAVEVGLAFEEVEEERAVVQ